MKTLYLYLTRQVLATLGMTVFVFTFVLLLGNVIKEILQLVIQRQATLGLAFHAILLLIPYVLAFSLPIGMLTAALLVFGRLSADQELTAARASGISLVSLVVPVLGLSLVMSGLCAWLNFDLAPSSRAAYVKLLHRAGLKQPSKLLQSNQYVPFGKYIVFVGHVHDDGTNLDDVHVSEWDDNNLLNRWAIAKHGYLIIDDVNKQITLYMLEMASATRENGWSPSVSGDFPLGPVPFPTAPNEILAVSDMTFSQLRAQLARFDRGTPPVVPSGASKEDLLKARREVERASTELAMPVLVYLNQQVAFSFACVGFALVGIPLAIRGHRRETSIGIATALVLVLIYYSFMVLGQAWENHPERYPCLIIWLPDFIFQAVGALLLWRINKSVG